MANRKSQKSSGFRQFLLFTAICALTIVVVAGVIHRYGSVVRLGHDSGGTNHSEHGRRYLIQGQSVMALLE
jgi:hypothetical protein